MRPDGCQRGACTDHIDKLKGYCCFYFWMNRRDKEDGGDVGILGTEYVCVLKLRRRLLCCLLLCSHRITRSLRSARGFKLSPSRPSATLSSPPTLSYAGFSFLHKPVHELIRALATFFPISSLIIIAFCARSALPLFISSQSTCLSHGCNSSTAKANQEGLSR